MAEIEDAVLPVLKKIQDDMANGFRRVEKQFAALDAKVVDIAENLLDLTDKVSTMNRHMTHHMGITIRHRSDFEDLRDEVSDLKTRVNALESRSS